MSQLINNKKSLHQQWYCIKQKQDKRSLIYSKWVIGMHIINSQNAIFAKLFIHKIDTAVTTNIKRRVGIHQIRSVKRHFAINV